MLFLCKLSAAADHDVLLPEPGEPLPHVEAVGVRPLLLPPADHQVRGGGDGGRLLRVEWRAVEVRGH